MTCKAVFLEALFVAAAIVALPVVLLILPVMWLCRRYGTRRLTMPVAASPAPAIADWLPNGEIDLAGLCSRLRLEMEDGRDAVRFDSEGAFRQED